MKPILLVASPYYTTISDMLIAGASAVLQQTGIEAELVTVSGALEIPAAIALAHRSGRYSGYVALGCVLRGETSHYDIVSNESARALQDIAVHQLAAIGNAILTCENEAQAIERADPAQGNKGGEAVNACLGLIQLRNALGLESA